ncbi:MAG: urease accessory protein UreE [Roseiarcus sp.]|jgi:urease accessory protein
MLHAHSVIPAGQWSGEPVDAVVLDYDERYRRRFAMTGVRGLGFLLDLPEAVMLRAGDGLKLEDGGIVEVVAAPEPLAEIRAADAAALTRVAWHLGNRHLPTELTKRSLRIRRDAVIEDMARGLGATVVAIEAPFNPEGGAYVRAAGGQDHDHPHGDHDHRHDHGHDHHDHGHGHAHAHAHGDDHKH